MMRIIDKIVKIVANIIALLLKNAMMPSINTSEVINIKEFFLCNTSSSAFLIIGLSYYKKRDCFSNLFFYFIFCFQISRIFFVFLVTRNGGLIIIEMYNE